jgi:hypothetical protein
MIMAYQFEKLEVWPMAVEDIDLIDKIAELLPKNEGYNLRSQIIRAARRLRSISQRDRPGKVMLSRTAFWVWRCVH